METDGTLRLLEEIRDVQREYLADYRRVTQQTLELQQRIVARQEVIGRLYKRVVLVAGLLVAGLLFFLLSVVFRWSSVLFP
jgi:hypothetical protein